MLLGTFDDPIALWQYAERYLGVGTRTYSSFAADLEISAEYHPQQGRRSFLLPTFWVPARLGSYLDGPFDSALTAGYRAGGRFLLPVHPDTLAHPDLRGRTELAGCEPGPPIEVVPSANARTVFVERVDGRPVPPHFLKLHYPRRLSRFTRRLRQPVIAVQLWVAAQLRQAGVPFLPEVGGGVFGLDPRESWGFLIREVRCRGAAPAAVPQFTVPVFALYGQDYRCPDEPALLEQLIRASGEPALGYLTERVVRPLVGLWLDVLLGTGCVAEPHGQNALFAFSPRGGTQISYRDCAVYVDPVIRAGLGAGPDLPPTNVISRDVRMPREQVFSLAYDSFLGHHTLDYVARLGQRCFGVRPRELQDAARAQFAARGAGGLLPGTVYYYDQALHPDGAWRLVDTGRRPQWR